MGHSSLHTDTASRCAPRRWSWPWRPSLPKRWQTLATTPATSSAATPTASASATSVTATTIAATTPTRRLSYATSGAAPTAAAAASCAAAEATRSATTWKPTAPSPPPCQGDEIDPRVCPMIRGGRLRSLEDIQVDPIHLHGELDNYEAMLEMQEVFKNRTKFSMKS